MGGLIAMVRRRCPFPLILLLGAYVGAGSDLISDGLELSSLPGSSRGIAIRHKLIYMADELLNRIWYAGAYTNQLCTIDPAYGNSLIHLGEINSSVSDAVNVTWWTNYTITEGKSALVDGAKRDRLVWAGGMLPFIPTSMMESGEGLDTC